MSNHKETCGVILCGGEGTRLKPLTDVLNKHMIPLGERFMVEYPLEQMYNAGIRDCVIVTNAKDVSDFAGYLGDEWPKPVTIDESGMNISYAVQNETGGGIANAIGAAEEFSSGRPLCVMLGDNIFTECPVTPKDIKTVEGGKAVIVVKKVDNPELNARVTINAGGVEKIEEKPEPNGPGWVQTGAYLYPPDVFDKIRLLTPSFRGEVEVTDLNMMYLKEGRLEATVYDGGWVDAGTSFNHLRAAAEAVRKKEND